MRIVFAVLLAAGRARVRGVNVDAVGTTDSATFHSAGIPVLSLHSVTHYDTHWFVSALLTYLDRKLP